MNMDRLAKVVNMHQPDTASLPVRKLVDLDEQSLVATIRDMNPWSVTQNLKALVHGWVSKLPSDEYNIHGDQAVHKSATIEPTAQLKGPLIIGPGCFVANGALLRDGIWLDENVIVGHCVELKSTMMMAGSKVAHLSFVGDSLLGFGVNVEAGAMLANYRNEWQDKTIQICINGRTFSADCDKFGSALGDDARVGAGAVLAPGTIVRSGEVVRRGQVVDQIIGR